MTEAVSSASDTGTTPWLVWVEGIKGTGRQALCDGTLMDADIVLVPKSCLDIRPFSCPAYTTPCGFDQLVVSAGQNRKSGGVVTVRVSTHQNSPTGSLSLLFLAAAIPFGRYATPARFYEDRGLGDVPNAFEIDKFVNDVSLDPATVTRTTTQGRLEACGGDGSDVCTETVAGGPASLGSPVITSRNDNPGAYAASLVGLATSANSFVLLNSPSVDAWIQGATHGVWGYTGVNLTGDVKKLGSCDRHLAKQVVDLAVEQWADKLQSLRIDGPCRVDGHNDPLPSTVSRSYWFTDTDLGEINKQLNVVEISSVDSQDGLYLYTDTGFRGRSVFVSAQEGAIPRIAWGGMWKNISSIRVVGGDRVDWFVEDDPTPAWVTNYLEVQLPWNYVHRLNTDAADLKNSSPLNWGLSGWNDVITGWGLL